MKPTTIFIVALFSIGTIFTSANNVSLQTATEVAKNFYFSHKGINLNNNEVLIEKIAIDNSDTTYYIFNYSGNKGFLILSADDVTTPVIGYSFEGNYDNNNVPSQLEWLLSEYHNQIKEAKIQNKKQALPTNNEWSKLFNKISYKSNGSVSPLTTTTWNQSPYYNDYCPYDSTKQKRTPAGCVAIALSQTIKYWNHPSQGKGSKSYVSDYGTLSADFGNTTYNWSLMPNSISSTNKEVAQFIYHVGISVSMDYGVDGSSAYFSAIDDALKNYFRYSNNTKFVEKTSYTDASWESLISSELDNKRVVIICARDSADKVGHAFVCDGYDGSTFHINWGWGGTLNGYFQLNNMVTWSYVWTKSLSAIVGIEPAPTYCIGTKNITDTGGTIEDGSGTNNYTDYTDCSWLISNSSAQSITLSFKAFDTEKNYDYVYVYNGTSTSATLLGKFSGNTIPSSVTSSGGNLYIRFTSDGSTTKTGWTATYSMTFASTSSGNCSGSTTLTSSSGSFSDGSGSSDYADDSDCKWLIQPTGAGTVTLSFSSFDLEDGYDFVNVYDGSTTSSKLVASYTGSSVPSSVTSSGSSMLVTFTSDYMISGKGFDASYKGNTSSSTTSYASLPYSTSFESNLDSYWKTASSSTVGRIQVTSSNSPYDGSKQLTMDVSTSGTYCTNEAWLRLNLSGITQCYMTLFTKSFNEDSHTSDGIYFSNNGGTSFTKVASYTTSTTSWKEVKLDIDQLASTAGLSLTSTFVIKFQQYDNYSISNDGMGFDKINVVSGSLKDNGLTVIENNFESKIPIIQVMPNPFSNSTTIQFVLNTNSNVNMEIFNSLGQKVKTLLNESMPAGEHSIEWNATDESNHPLPNGFYSCVIKTEKGSSSIIIGVNK